MNFYSINICNFRAQYCTDLAQSANKGYWRHFTFLRVVFVSSCSFCSMPAPLVFGRGPVLVLLIIRATNFWPKNLKFWLYNLQILTLFWPINFLRLQLQNNSALGVEVNPETYSYTLCFEILKYLVV